MKFTLTLCLLTIPALGQVDDKPTPNAFRGLGIDTATPDDAIKAFGKPKEDKVDRVRIQCYDTNLLVDKRDEKVFRVLLFKKIPGFRTVQLAFLDDRLVFVARTEKELPAVAGQMTTGRRRKLTRVAIIALMPFVPEDAESNLRWSRVRLYATYGV